MGTLGSLPDKSGKELLERRLLIEIRQNGRLFFRLAYNILRQVQCAEDACQQAMLRAYENRHRLNDTESLKPWLVRIVVNEACRMLRRRKTELKAIERIGDWAEPAMGSWERSEFRQAFHTALDELEELTRVVVILRVVEGMPGSEVSNLLGCSPAQVSRRLHTGLQYLRERLARDYAPA